MKGTIFLKAPNGQLSPMREAEFDLEDELQRLLADHPDLLPGDQIDPDNPRRWLLVDREVGVPLGLGEGARLWLDHLFIDQDGIPTFVECKRGADPRSRREVVAQMLDYAANGSAYWDVAELRARITTEKVAEIVGSGERDDLDRFWAGVGENLQKGRVRLLFALDEAPKELRRLVEFLNEQMQDVEVLILEVRQFQAADGQVALVPRVLGRTERAAARRSAPGRRLTVDEVLSQIEHVSPVDRRWAEEFLGWLKAQGATIQTTPKGYVPVFESAAGSAYSVRVGAADGVTVCFHWIRRTAPFDVLDVRRELLGKFSEVAGSQLDQARADGKFSIPLSRLRQPGVADQLRKTMSWYLGKLEVANQS